MASISLPTAALIAGGLGAAGSVASGVIGSNAAESAANTQATAAANALALQKSEFQTTQNNLQPFISTGASALPALSALAGGSGSAAITSELSQLPGYQFQLNQGEKATQNSYAAQGLGQSGAALKGSADYAEGLAGTSYQNLFNNIYNTATLGSNAATGLGTLALGSANSQTNALTSGAAAQAAGTIGSANATSNALTAGIGGVNTSALVLGLNNAGMFGTPASTNSGQMTPNQLSTWNAST